MVLSILFGTLNSAYFLLPKIVPTSLFHLISLTKASLLLKNEHLAGKPDNTVEEEFA